MPEPVHILLIDDDPDESVMVNRLLRDAWRPGLVQGRGYSLTHLTDPSEARIALAEEHFDCAILDQRLGGVSGTHLLHLYRSWNGHRPVVMMTYLDDQRADEQAWRDGASDFLIKGQFTGDRLFRTLIFAMRASEEQMQLMQAKEQVEREFQNQIAHERDLRTELAQQLDRLTLAVRALPTSSAPAAEIERAIAAMRETLERRQPLAGDHPTDPPPTP